MSIGTRAIGVFSIGAGAAVFAAPAPITQTVISGAIGTFAIGAWSIGGSHATNNNSVGAGMSDLLVIWRRRMRR